jgi:hypothetical protein
LNNKLIPARPQRAPAHGRVASCPPPADCTACL